MQPKVTLINPPTHVMETVWILWEASKIDGHVPLDVEEVRRAVPQSDLEKLFWQVLAQHIPVAEHINFVFMLEGVSVSLREQMVRHRIGTHVGDRLAVDIVPDLADSTWWSQSMRIQDMGKFADNEMYRVPETLAGKTIPEGEHREMLHGNEDMRNSNWSAEEVFRRTMDGVQDAYKALVAAGVPMEDARELIPLGAQHRISWGINLQALLHVLGKRGCWILQLGIWGPIIHGMVKELAEKVHPMFARIIAPPCISADDKFKGCIYQKENDRRMEGDDAHPPCPLWLCRDEHGQVALDLFADHSDEPGWKELLRTNTLTRKEVLIQANDLVPYHREMKRRAEEYRALWKHDPYTWESDGG
jgi:thymidylate synthase ThyX